jgi:hypothetical protein
MSQRLLFVILAVAALAIGVGVGVVLAGDDSDDDSSSGDRPTSGIVSTRFAKSIRLDTPRAAFERQAKEQPVDVDRQEAGRRTFSIEGLSPKRRQEYIRKYGQPNENDNIVFPPETYTCLLYHSEKPKTYSWRFCFGEDRQLDSVSTAPPL